MGSGSSTPSSDESSQQQTSVPNQRPATAQEAVRWYIDAKTQEYMRETCFDLNIHHFKDKRFSEDKFKENLTECFDRFLKSLEITKQIAQEVYNK